MSTKKTPAILAIFAYFYTNICFAVEPYFHPVVEVPQEFLLEAHDDQFTNSWLMKYFHDEDLLFYEQNFHFQLNNVPLLDCHYDLVFQSEASRQNSEDALEKDHYPPKIRLRKAKAKEAKPCVQKSKPAHKTSQFAYQLPSEEEFAAVFIKLKKDHRETFAHLFQETGIATQASAQITNQDVESLAKHFVKALNLVDSEYGKAFMKDLKSKFHRAHKGQNGHKLLKDWCSFLRVVFIRWGLFPADFLDGKYKIDAYARHALATYQTRMGH